MRRLVCLLLVTSLAVATDALAQTAPAAPAAPAPKAQRTVVVVADVFADETQNAKLRAQVYEAARRHGLDSLPRADVMGAAQGVDALEGGRVSNDRALLERLRVALGATVLLRVSMEWEREGNVGVRVTAVREGAAESQVVQASTADAGGPVGGAVDSVLAAVGAAAPATSQKPAPTATPAPEDKPAEEEGPIVGQRYYVTPGNPAVEDGPSAIAAGKAWEIRGGALLSYEVRGLATVLYRPDASFTDTNPFTDSPESGTAEQWGIGGGVGVRASLMFLSLPDPSTSGGGGWFGFRLGAGLDGNVLYSAKPAGFNYNSATDPTDKDVQRENLALFYPTGSVQVGLHFGIGRLLSPTIWRGVVLGLAYSPAVIWSLQIGETAFDTDFNHAGFEVTFDIASLEAREGITHEPQIRLFAFVLPRIRDDLPWLTSLGIGAAWY